MNSRLWSIFGRRNYVKSFHEKQLNPGPKDHKNNDKISR